MRGPIRSHGQPFLAALGVVLWVWFCQDLPLFWDNLLNGRLAIWYGIQGFSSLLPPESLDAGHPPFFNLYLAGVARWILGDPGEWEIQALFRVWHWAMLPFLVLLVFQWSHLCQRFLPPSWQWVGMMILVIQPTLLAQSSMVSPDITLVAFFLLGLNGVLQRKQSWISFGTLCMVMVSFRGILLVPSLYLVSFVLDKGWGNWKASLRKVLPFLPAALGTLFWLGYHWQVQGWLLSPPADTYGGHRELLGLRGIARNVAILGWRLLDYGMVFPCTFIGVAFLLRWKKIREAKQTKPLTIIILVPGLWLAILMLPFSNPIGHRYFLPTSLTLLLMAVVLIHLLETSWRRWFVPLALGVGLIGGHFWIYPPQIAQGWDASLAHWNYFALSRDLDEFTQGRPPYCTGFPMASDLRYFSDTLVKNQPLTWERIDDIGWENCNCILESNVSNDFSDDQLEELQDTTKWELILNKDQMGVYLKYYVRIE